MSTKIVDRCMFIATLGGTTDWTVSSAVQGYMTPAQAGVSNGDTVYYAAESSDKSQWELGSGIYTSSGTSVARTTILFSSNSNSKVTFTSAPKVFLVLPAEFLSTLPSGANPSATASDTAVNGSASTFMRSDGAPAIQKGSSSVFGVVKVDGTTITSSGGVLSASASSAGTPPTIVQHALVNGICGSVVLGSAPTNGNLLIAMTVNASGVTANTGWNRESTNGSGTDFSAVFSKTAGASESTIQTPITQTPTTGITMMWELQSAASIITTNSSVEFTGTSYTSAAYPAITNVLHLAIMVISQNSGTITAYNMTQDDISNTGTRRGYGGHSTAALPIAQLLTAFGATVSAKACSALITA